MNEKTNDWSPGVKTIYKDRQGGAWVYWFDSEDGKILLKPEAVQKYLDRGARLVCVEGYES